MFLAGKVEESPKKLQFVAIACHKLWNRRRIPPPADLSDSSPVRARCAIAQGRARKAGGCTGTSRGLGEGGWGAWWRERRNTGDEADRALLSSVQGSATRSCLFHTPSPLSLFGWIPAVQEYEALRQEILRCERVLLHTIAFDLCVEHPYKYLIETVKAIQSKGVRQSRFSSGCQANSVPG